jgi:hypothetical protein
MTVRKEGLTVSRLKLLLYRAVYPSAEELRFLTFDPQVFFFLLLPPIIVSYNLMTCIRM